MIHKNKWTKKLKTRINRIAIVDLKHLKHKNKVGLFVAYLFNKSLHIFSIKWN